ncbi:MAG TPA: 3-dehydroquinate synthase [Atopobiaceae bacterium]|mgnify:CR=1 FL=1|nr:3-dehydroquinate synthase [Atopobiaceae bacterium]
MTEAAENVLVRQWVTMPGGSMDARMGVGLADRAGKELKSTLGKPRLAVLACTEGAPADHIERIRRSLTDAGFSVEQTMFPSGEAALSLDAVQPVLATLGELGATSGDGLVVVGDTGALSLASFVAKGWCNGISLMEYPLDLRAALEGSCTPLGFTVGAHPEMLTFPAATRYVYCDFGLMEPAFEGEEELFGRALMVCSAVADTEKAFGKLWDNIDAYAEGDAKIRATVIGDAFRSRGRVISSSSVVVRDSLGFGRTFLRALRPLVPSDVPPSSLFAEGMRFAARLAAGQGDLAVDDVAAIDEVLDAFGLGYIEDAPFTSEELAQALKNECFLRSNRFQMFIPKSFGRIRLSTLSDELLAEHAGAWVGARS